MSGLTGEVIASLANMDEYERLLAAERISREQNIQMDALLRMVDDYLSAINHGNNPDQAFQTSPDQYSSSPEEQFNTPAPATAQRVQDAHRYRMKYDPSANSQQRAQEITEAIICPHCNAPLGIPSIRPIKVNCPSCMMESTFFE